MRLLATGGIAAVLGLFSSYGIYHAAAEPKTEAASQQAMFDYGSSGKSKVTICHKAGKKYVALTIPVAALNGHAKKDDIVPPVNGQPGINWDEKGQELHANGCR